MSELPRSRSLAVTLAAWAFGVALALGVLVGGVGQYTKLAERAQHDRRVSEIHQAVWAELVQSWGRSARMAVDAASARADLSELIAAGDGDAIERSLGAVFDAAGEDAALSSLSVVDAEGRVLAVRGAAPTTVAPRRAAPGGEHVSRYAPRQDHGGRLVLDVPVFARGGEYVGAVLLGADMRAMAGGLGRRLGSAAAVRLPSGEVFYGNRDGASILGSAEPDPERIGRDALVGDRLYRVTHRSTPEGTTLIVAGDATEIRRAIWRATALAWSACAVLMIGALWGGWHIVNRRLRPIRSLARIMNEDPADGGAAAEAALPVDRGDEVGLIARSYAALRRRLAGQIGELRAAQAQAEEASRAKSSFLANMSHEIRTPMTAILGYADLMLDLGLSAPERLDCAQTIRRNGEHLLTIVNDILDLSRIEAGRFAIELSECEPLAVAQDVVSLLRVRAQSKGVWVSLLVEHPVPREMRSDSVRLRQILLNLLGNAIKFTEEGEVALRMSSEERGDGSGWLIFEVCDSGIGMSPAQMERLFTPFCQGDSSMSRRFGGTGLGLSISKRLAELLGGDISVTSTPGAGSAFKLELPGGPASAWEPVDEDAPAPIAAAEPEVDHTDGQPLYGVRVLLAEDGADNQRLLAYQLRRTGAEVSVAANGRIAVEMATAPNEAAPGVVPFHIVLMDMQMPEMDGYEATRQLRRHGWAGPIIALTAHAMAGDRSRCIAAGCDDYISKPVDRDKLVGACKRWVARGELWSNRAA